LYSHIGMGVMYAMANAVKIAIIPLFVPVIFIFLELLFGTIQALVFAIVCLGLNLQWGYTGLFNIGVSGFYLVGAYAFALLCGPAHAGIVAGWGLPFVVGLVGAMVAEFDRRRHVVVAEANRLPGVSCITPKGAFYAFPNIKGTGFKAKPLASRLLEEEGVATIGGPDFGVHGEGYIRLSYANSTENIVKALGRIGDFLAKNAKAA